MSTSTKNDSDTAQTQDRIAVRPEALQQTLGHQILHPSRFAATSNRVLVTVPRKLRGKTLRQGESNLQNFSQIPLKQQQSSIPIWFDCCKSTRIRLCCVLRNGRFQASAKVISIHLGHWSTNQFNNRYFFPETQTRSLSQFASTRPFSE